jgi:hypothetical protein
MFLRNVQICPNYTALQPSDTPWPIIFRAQATTVTSMRNSRLAYSVGTFTNLVPAVSKHQQLEKPPATALDTVLASAHTQTT